MLQEDPANFSQPTPPRDPSTPEHDGRSIEDTSGAPSGKTGKTMAPFFPVIGRVTFKQMTGEPERGAGHLPSSVARLISLASLGAVLVAPLSGCSSYGDIPCAIPTPTATGSGTPVPDGTPTASCTTSEGRHYVWIYNRGGWVESDDGIHPKPNARGVGIDDASSGSDGRGGVGDGHGGGGHEGGDGG